MSELVRAAASSGGVASAASGVVRSSALDFGQSGSFFEDFISILPNEAVQVPIRSVIARGATQHGRQPLKGSQCGSFVAPLRGCTTDH